MFISEKDRFDKKLNALSQFEKQDKQNCARNKQDYIKKVNEDYTNMRAHNDYIRQEKEVYSLLQRTMKTEKYERVNF